MTTLRRSFGKSALAQRRFHWRGGAAARCLVGLALVGASAIGAANAASAAWNTTPTDSSWATGTNWTPGAAPGATSGTTSTDTATFSGTVTNGFGTAASPLLIDLNRNIQNITFTSAAASAYVIGTTGGNALLLTSGGTIQTASTVANIETVNAPLILEPASASTAGTYTFSSSAALAANVLNMGGAITLGTTTAADTLNLAGTNTGANTVSGTVSDTGTGGLVLNKSGAGSWTFGGSGTSTLAKGNITVNGGTLNFGSATDTPTLNITGSAGSGVGVFVISGNFGMNAGTLAVTSGQGLVLNGNNTYTQTGGAFTTNGRIELANGGGSSTVNVSAGTLTSTLAGGGIETVRGTSVINLSGTGAIISPIVDMTTTQISNGTAGNGPASSTFNLNGGTLTTGQIILGTNAVTGSGGTFNFNGGTLKSSAASTTYMNGLTNAFVKSGGAIIDTQAFTDTIGQNLLTDTVSTGGGLTKLGSGTLILGGTNTYTGLNTISAGVLGVTSDSSLGAAPGSATGNIQFTATGATLQDTTNNVTVNANRSISIPAGGTTTLDSSTNAFTVGGAISVTGSVTGTALALNSGTGGAGDLTGTVSDSGTTGGLIISKTGTGAFTFGGSNTSTLAKGQLSLNAGTLNFGSATETPTLNLNGQTGSGGNVGVYVKSGTFNMTSGTLNTTTTTQGLIVQNNGTVYNQTGGLLNTNGDFIAFANAGSVTGNISGGELRTSNRIELGVGAGASSTVNLSGTGLVTTPSLVMTTNQVNNAVTSTFNLGNGTVGGGTLAAGAIIHGSDTTAGSTTFSFNGGTLKSSASSTTFMQGLGTANVRNGGAVVNTNGFNDTIGQALVHSTVGGDNATDGGLTKLGAGKLTLTGANTYTGTTTVSAGTLALGANNRLNSASNVTLNGGTLSIANASGSPSFSQGTSTGTGPGTTATSFGAATLSVQGGVSTLDFGAGNTGGVFAFSGYDFSSTGILNIINYTGNAFNPATQEAAAGGGLDQLFFGGTGQTEQQLLSVYFINPSGVNGTYQARLLTTGEVVAPEPSQWAALLIGALGLGGLSLKARRRLA